MANKISEPLRQAKLTDLSLFIESGYIQSQWLTNPNGKTFCVYEPASEEVLGRVPNFSRGDFKAAIADAEKGFLEFSKVTTARQRGDILLKWYNLVITHIEDLGKILCLENGKTFTEAKAEVEYAASFIKWFAEEAPRAYGGDNTILSFTGHSGVHIEAAYRRMWHNHPMEFPRRNDYEESCPSARCRMLSNYQTPSETPFSCLALVKLAVDAGIPGNCIQVVPTKDRDATSELLTNPIVKKVSFTGSTSVGKALSKLATGTMKKVSMELGGNAPYIVFEDADLEKAVEGILVCKYRCTGQTCVCANRIYVQESILEKFTSHLVSHVEKFKCGFGLDSTVTHGPLVNRAAVDKVDEHVKDALSKGAKLVIGGKNLSINGRGFFYEPTIITGCKANMVVTTEETFGPLAAIYSFRTEDEVVAAANNSVFGLASYFFSQDIDRIKRVTKALEAGMVGVNTGRISSQKYLSVVSRSLELEERVAYTVWQNTW